MDNKLQTQQKHPTSLALQGLSKPTLAKLNEDYPKVKNVISETEIENLLNFLVQILNLKTNSKQEQDDLDFQMVLILDLIKSKFGNLTIPEIKEAFKMYVSKEFNIKVFRIIDCVVVGDVLSAFISFRNENLRIYSSKKNNLLQSAKSNFTENEILEIRERFLKLIFDDIKETGLSSNAWHLYEDLEKSGKINISKIEKKLLYSKQLRLYEKETKAEIKGKFGKNAKPFLVDLENKITSKNTIGSVANRCKSIIASNYLKQFINDFEKFKLQTV